MTVAGLVVDLSGFSHFGTLAPDSPLFFQVGEHAFICRVLETPSAGTGVSSALCGLSRLQPNRCFLPGVWVSRTEV